MGQAPGKDYSTVTGGQGAQYSCNTAMFTLIDFTVDVTNAVRDYLSGWAREYYTRLLNNPHPNDFSVQTEEELKVHSEMGRVYLVRGLYPMTTYMTSSKDVNAASLNV